MIKKLLFTVYFLFVSSLHFVFASGLDDWIDEKLSPWADAWEGFVLTPLEINRDVKIPLILIILSGGALFFTLMFRFINIRRLPLAIGVVRGKFDFVEGKSREIQKTDQINVVDGDNPDTIRIEGEREGEVNHFQALTAALSATVGLGNISGVAIAIVVGGPGAMFWMIIAGLIGMSSKFVECTLGVKYREVGPDGTVYGGPMYYLSKGLSLRGYTGLGKVLGVLFAILCVGGSFGGGNMFQANQSSQQLITQFGLESGYAGTLIGVVMAILVGIVIIGGIKRIAKVTERVVPFMAGIYVLAALVILMAHFSQIPAAFALIITEAFQPSSAAGGVLGVIVTGFQRAAFSNEAGVGSAAIAHSAVKTRYAASEGIVALLEPLVDTVIICTMTALVIIITGNYLNPEGLNGVDLTSRAFASVIPYFDYVLTVAIFLFAFSTMLSWSYYGLQAWKYLFGRSTLADILYKILFLLFIVVGAAAGLGAVIQFSDAMILAMVFPNMIGLILLFPIVKAELTTYLAAIRKRFGEG